MAGAFDKTEEPERLAVTPDDATPVGGEQDASAEGALLMRRLESRLFDVEIKPVKLGRFALLDTIGAGGMGVVHLGYDDVLDRRVAIKLIRRERSASPEARQRLLREARAMARLSHPNVVQVFEAGEHEGSVFVAMEFVEGRTVREWLEVEDRTVEQSLALFCAAGRGLDAAHAAGVIHRDFKPDNVLVTADDTPKVTDFGLAGFGEQPHAPTTKETDEADTLTLTGSVLGTPRYMSPEQFGGELTDGRSDQFSFCVALYEAVYGQPPFAGDTLQALAGNVIAGELRPPPPDARVPRHVAQAIARGLSSEPDDRWPSMSVLLRELQPAARGRRRLGVGFGLGALAIAAAVVFADEDDACTGAAAELAPAWSDDRRDAIAAAIEAVDADFATAVWSRAQPQLERYAGAWIDAHSTACRATRVYEAQSEAILDRRMACLYRGRAALQAVADSLQSGRKEAIAAVDELTTRLPDVAACSDIDALSAGVAPPEAGVQADAVEEVEQRLAGSRAARAAGSYQTSLELAVEAETLARESGYEPALTRATVERGKAHQSLRQSDEGIAAYDAALRPAMRLGQWGRGLRCTDRNGMAARRTAQSLRRVAPAVGRRRRGSPTAPGRTRG